MSLCFGLAQSGQQHGRQDGNDGNDHQQFDKGKRPPRYERGKSFVSLHVVTLATFVSFTRRSDDVKPIGACAIEFISILLSIRKARAFNARASDLQVNQGKTFSTR